MDLNELIADALRRKGLKSPKRSKKDTPTDIFRRTKEELRALALERCVPVSIHLRMVRQTCTCGSQYTSINTTPLVKRVSPSLTHFEAHADLTEFKDLPRFTEIVELGVPYCESCFTDSKVVYVKPSIIAPEGVIPNDKAETS